jgi:hypothetical protein
MWMEEIMMSNSEYCNGKYCGVKEVNNWEESFEGDIHVTQNW